MFTIIKEQVVKRTTSTHTYTGIIEFTATPNKQEVLDALDRHNYGGDVWYADRGEANRFTFTAEVYID